MLIVDDMGRQHIAPETALNRWIVPSDEKRDYLVYEGDVLDYVMNELHTDNLAPLLPCHPRDLISIAADLAVYDGQPRRINKARMRRDRPSYFVSTNTGGTVRHKLSPDRGYKSC